MIKTGKSGKNMDLATIKEEARLAAEEVLAGAEHTKAGDFFILGCSTSEVKGSRIGKDSNLDIGSAIIESVLAVCQQHGIYLAVQGCEHINRALTIERSALSSHALEEVNVVPQLHAGGAASVAAWKLLHDATCVEFIKATCGMDIGDTEIGMHIKHVQKPLRLQHNKIGEARVTALYYRPKLIGGERASHR